MPSSALLSSAAALKIVHLPHRAESPRQSWLPSSEDVCFDLRVYVCCGLDCLYYFQVLSPTAKLGWKTGDIAQVDDEVLARARCKIPKPCISCSLPLDLGACFIVCGGRVRACFPCGNGAAVWRVVARWWYSCAGCDHVRWPALRGSKGGCPGPSYVEQVI